MLSECVIQDFMDSYVRSVIRSWVQDNRIILYLNFQDLFTYLYPRSWPRSYLQDVSLGYGIGRINKGRTVLHANFVITASISILFCLFYLSCDSFSVCYRKLVC